jgi:hypothetical protein
MTAKDRRHAANLVVTENFADPFRPVPVLTNEGVKRREHIHPPTQPPTQNKTRGMGEGKRQTHPPTYL